MSQPSPEHTVHQHIVRAVTVKYSSTYFTLNPYQNVLFPDIFL